MSNVHLRVCLGALLCLAPGAAVAGTYTNVIKTISATNEGNRTCIQMEGTMATESGCTPGWYCAARVAGDNYDAISSLLMSAFVAGKRVTVKFQGCENTGNRAKIIAVDVFKQ